MPVKTPANLRIVNKAIGAGHLDELVAQVTIRRIGFPEPLVASKVRQAGIDTHARAGGDHQRLGFLKAHSQGRPIDILTHHRSLQP